MIPGMDENDFKNTMKAIIFNNGGSLYQKKHYYTTTGLHSNSYAFGDAQSRAEYSIENKDGVLEKWYDVYVAEKVSGIVFPEGIQYGDSFASVLRVLNLTDEYETAIKTTEEYRRPDFDVSNADGTKTIGVHFKGWHGEPVDTGIKTAEATVYYEEKTEKESENGKKYTYTRRMKLHFSGGKLKYFGLSLWEECDAAEEPAINNDRVSLKFVNPVYEEKRENGLQVRWEEIAHQNQKIYVTYSVKSETAVTFSWNYDGALSADQLLTFQAEEHTVHGEARYTDVLGTTDLDIAWFDLNDSYLSVAGVEFFSGNVYFPRPSNGV
jgi:hypothetical protein